MPTTIGGTSHQSFVQSYNYNHCAGNLDKSLERKYLPIKMTSRSASITPSIIAGDDNVSRNKKPKLGNSYN
jgi:hypothetical protein